MRETSRQRLEPAAGVVKGCALFDGGVDVFDERGVERFDVEAGFAFKQFGEGGGKFGFERGVHVERQVVEADGIFLWREGSDFEVDRFAAVNARD